MFEINQNEWAMVGLSFKYKGQQKNGELWWNYGGDILFKENLDGDGHQFYEVTSSDGDVGIGVRIKKMQKLSNSKVKMNL